MYRVSRFALIGWLVLAMVSLALAAKEFRPPRATDVNHYPARDEHPQEHITVAIDPYDDAQKAAIFPTRWSTYGYLPVQLIVANSGDKPIALTDMRVELITLNRSRLQPATEEDLYRRLSRTKRRGDEGSPLPMPIPRKKPDVGAPKQARQEVEAAQFQALAVDPQGIQSGFLFFDIEGIREPLAGAHIYVSGITDANGQQVMFFDIPLEKYLNRAGK